jgi:hypothetical protein
VTEPEPTRDHTERMLRAFGYEVKTEGNKISLIGGGKLGDGYSSSFRYFICRILYGGCCDYRRFRCYP